MKTRGFLSGGNPAQTNMARPEDEHRNISWRSYCLTMFVVAQKTPSFSSDICSPSNRYLTLSVLLLVWTWRRYCAACVGPSKSLKAAQTAASTPSTLADQTPSKYLFASSLAKKAKQINKLSHVKMSRIFITTARRRCVCSFPHNAKQTKGEMSGFFFCLFFRLRRIEPKMHRKRKFTMGYIKNKHSA